MGKLRAVACILALGSALAYTGCSDDLDDKPGFGPFPNPNLDAGTGTDAGTDAGTGGTDAGTDAGTDGGTGGAEFTTFVRELIVNQTTATGTPVEVENQTFVDSEPTGAFPETFFQDAQP